MSHILLLLGCFQSWTVSSDCTLEERYLDEDGDGYGTEALSACPDAHPARYSATEGGDCDDSSAQINPAAAEDCDGLDQDCDQSVDEGTVVPFWPDADADGFGSGEPTQACADDPPFAPAATQDGDCEDLDAGIFPGADELCNTLDDDCDSSVDENPSSGPTWYSDGDGDGFGEPSTALVSCEAPTGMVAEGRDCDDSQSSVYPGAPPICGDGQLNDCDATSECRFEGEVRLNSWDQEIDLSFGDGLGTTLSTGDLSGDGLADLAAGTSDGSIEAVVVAFDLFNPEQTVFYSSQGGTGFGASHDMSDLDGDGVEDLVVVADERGVAYLFTGPLDPNDSYVPEVQANGELSFDPQRSTGAAILAPGDMDGDGAPELTLSEPDNAWVQIYSGYWSPSSDHGAQLTASFSSDESDLGERLAHADVNGDGQPELAISSRKTAYLLDYRGSSGTADLDDAADALDIPSRMSAVSAGGDSTGDGLQAIWVSSEDLNSVALWTTESNWSDIPIRLNLDSTHELNGPVSGGQDLDGDGHLDLFLSVTDSLGESGACLSYGPFTGGVLTPDYCADEKGGSDAGDALLLLPDVDGDGAPDLAVSDPSADGQDGIVYLLYGQSL